MIAIPSTVQVFLGTEPQDFRKSIDGLAGVVQTHLQRNPMTGDVFVFHNRRRNALKLLYWDHGGFCLVYKRLERGRFRVPQRHEPRHPPRRPHCATANHRATGPVVVHDAERTVNDSGRVVGKNRDCGPACRPRRRSGSGAGGNQAPRLWTQGGTVFHRATSIAWRRHGPRSGPSVSH